MERLESEDDLGLVQVVDAIRIATGGRGRGIREWITAAPRTRAAPPTHGDFEAIVRGNRAAASAPLMSSGRVRTRAALVLDVQRAGAVDVVGSVLHQ
jgi:hypothetical protein